MEYKLTYVPTVTYLYRRYYNNGSSSRQNFIYELNRATTRRATDPRDHVFALLGHYSAPKRPDGQALIKCDYTKSKFEVFHEVAYTTLEFYNSLITLNAVQHKNFDSGIAFLLHMNDN
jgi:hypothetical protein